MVRVFSRLTILLTLVLPLHGGANVAIAQDSALVTLDEESHKVICQERPGCALAELHDAGTDTEGHKLTVAEIHLDLQPGQPDDAWTGGCLSEQPGQRDGGREYWLLKGDEAPALILKSCNDGYGAAGVGDDQVDFEDNLMTHNQMGGSAWRWEGATRWRLSPLQLLSHDNCTFHEPTLFSGTATQWAYDPLLSVQTERFIADGSPNPFEEMDIYGTAGEPPGYGCPDWEPGQPHFQPHNLVAHALPIPQLYQTDGNGVVHLGAQLARGQGLGDCSQHLSTDGNYGILFSDSVAVRPEDSVDIRFVQESPYSLIIQIGSRQDNWTELLPMVFDKTGQSALSLWTDNPERSEWQVTLRDLSDMPQILATETTETPLPKLDSWTVQSGDRLLMVIRLTWPALPDDEWSQFLSGGVAVRYSVRREEGHYHTVSNVPLNEAWEPLRIPEAVELLPRIARGLDPKAPVHYGEPLWIAPGSCKIQEGVLSFIPNIP